MAKRKVTQAEVAKQLGVSQTTVSMALREVPGARISEDKRKRILRHLELVNYKRPRRQTGLPPLGLLWGETGNPALLAALRDAAGVANRRLLIENWDGTVHWPSDANGGLTGMIVAAQVDGEALAALAGQLPLLMVNQTLEHPVCDEIVADERLGVRLLLEHLYGLGHRRIAFVGSDLSSDSFLAATRHFHERAHSFRETAIDLGVFGDGALFRPLFRPQLAGADKGRAFFKQVLSELLSLPAPPTAIVAYNDIQARAILHDAHALGVSVPEQLSLVGFDNLPAALPWDVALTTVDPNFKAQADIAVSLLLGGNGHAGEREQVRILCRPRLVVGETTKPPAGKSPVNQ